MSQYSISTVGPVANAVPVSDAAPMPVYVVSFSAAIDTELPAAVALSDALANPTAPAVGAYMVHWNGTTYERTRGTLEGTLLASASRTVTLSSADQTNYNAKGVKVFLNVTSAGTGSITLKIEAKDPISGAYVTILEGAAVVTAVMNVYTVRPGLPATANVSASDGLPRTWRVTVTHNNANAITYSVGYALLL